MQLKIYKKLLATIFLLNFCTNIIIFPLTFIQKAALEDVIVFMDKLADEIFHVHSHPLSRSKGENILFLEMLSLILVKSKQNINLLCWLIFY